MSMDPKICDGGPAFPWFNSENGRGENGMSLRDYFAIRALQPLIAGGWVAKVESDCYVVVPDLAYKIADAMLKARLK